MRIQDARAVKQKVWNEAENRERDWGETLHARKTLTPRFPDFFTDLEKIPTVLQSGRNCAEIAVHTCEQKP